MLRQLWIFLDESDERELLARLEGAGTFRVARGRFFRGDPARLEDTPEVLLPVELTPGEHTTHVLPGTFAPRVIVHEITEGPFAGCHRIDEARSEVLTLVRVAPTAAGLAPSRVQAAAHAWFGGAKERKSQDFARWLGQAMRLVETAYPATRHDWLRVGPGARSWAEAGGRLHYLFREVPLEPSGSAPTRPHQRA